jgi:putative addiction module component (TIGR02574 family)
MYMGESLDQIKQDLVKLPVVDRESLIEFLIQSLDEPNDPDAEQAWADELERRNAEIESGTAEFKSAEQSLKEAREQLKCRR